MFNTLTTKDYHWKILETSLTSYNHNPFPYKILASFSRWRHRTEPACYKMLHSASELAGLCESGNEPSGFIKGGEFLD